MLCLSWGWMGTCVGYTYLHSHVRVSVRHTRGFQWLILVSPSTALHFIYRARVPQIDSSGYPVFPGDLQSLPSEHWDYRRAATAAQFYVGARDPQAL